jgi:hypothetical protein
MYATKIIDQNVFYKIITTEEFSFSRERIERYGEERNKRRERMKASQRGSFRFAL